jgi:hypothetical protein
MRLRKSWLVAIYGAILRLLHGNYYKLVSVIDFRRVLPLAADWAATLVEQGIGEPATFGFIDGKAVRFSKPGTGNAAERFAKQHGVSVNLVQRVRLLCSTVCLSVVSVCVCVSLSVSLCLCAAVLFVCEFSEFCTYVCL